MLLFVACGCNKLAIKFILLWALQTFNGASRNTSGSLHMCVVHFTNVLPINTLRPRKNWRHFANDIFICIFLNGNVWIPIEISLKFVSKGPLNNIPALVQWMAWQHPGFKPLSEAVVVSLPTHTCIYCILNHTYLLYAWITAWMGSNIFLKLNLNLNDAMYVFYMRPVGWAKFSKSLSQLCINTPMTWIFCNCICSCFIYW